MNLVDSCGWLEYLVDGPNAGDYKRALVDEAEPTHLLLPSICLQEVFKVFLLRKGQADADAVSAYMQGCSQLIPHDADIAMEAAVLSNAHKLALADSIIYATALRHKAKLWTQDAAFQGLPGVHFVVKKKP